MLGYLQMIFIAKIWYSRTLFSSLENQILLVMQYVSTNKKYIGDLSTQVVEIY